MSAFKFPSFDPGTDESLMQSKWAKMVKRFIEAFNSFEVRRGDKDSIKIADRNVVLTLNSETLGGEEGEAIDVVGSDGKLNKVAKHSTWATPTAFPTVLKVVNGTTSIVLDSTGFTMTDTAGSGKSFTITFAALLAGKTVSLRVDDYCDGTTAKSQQHVATAPYV